VPRAHRPLAAEQPFCGELAINLPDLDRVDQFIRTTLLAGKVDTGQAVVTDRNRMDEIAVRFTCGLLAAACVCDTIREHDRRAGDPPVRVYLRRAEAWVKLPASAVLSVVADGGVRLNPLLFPNSREPIEPAAPVPALPTRPAFSLL